MTIPRLSTAHWMAVVAGVALGLTVYGIRREADRRAAERYARAYEHAADAGLTPSTRGLAIRTPRRDYHAAMMRKWLDASRHPWSPVAPDPPPPGR